MKKKLLLSVTISTVVLGLMTPVSNAAPVTTKTNGTAGFEIDGGEWDIIKPKVDITAADEVIIPTDVSTYVKTENVHLMHVPNFKFGTGNKINPNSATYSSLYETYKEVDPAGLPTGTPIAIPQFVQVGDGSGSITTKWAVTVIQDKFFKSGTHELKNTKIKINGATAMNNLKANATVIKGLVATSAAPKEIAITGTTGAAGLEVLARDAYTTASNGNSTTGTKSSVVFKGDYKEADYHKTSTNNAATERNKDVQLVVPQGENPMAQVYTTDFTWTLTATP